MDKKAFMVDFLTVVILAIIIFAPACLVASKLFRTSTQAKENFQDFVKELNDFASDKDEPIGAKKGSLLIMDEGTAIVYFEQGKDVVVEVDVSGPELDHKMTFIKPSECGGDKNCLCLFRKLKVESEFLNQKIISERVLCSFPVYNLELESCSLGEPKGVNSYQCSNGFIIERNVAKTTYASSSRPAYYENPRRRNIFLTKLDNTIRLAGETSNE